MLISFWTFGRPPTVALAVDESGGDLFFFETSASISLGGVASICAASRLRFLAEASSADRVLHFFL